MNITITITITITGYVFDLIQQEFSQ